MIDSLNVDQGTFLKLEEQIVQLNRKLEVFTKQNERQTTEINTLRNKANTLEFKLDVTTATKDWLQSELDTVSRQLIGMSISKKVADKKLEEMEKEMNDAKLHQNEMDKQSATTTTLEDGSSDKENMVRPIASKWNRLASQKAVLARHRRKTSNALAAKHGPNV